MKTCFRWGELLLVCPFVRICVRNRVLGQGYYQPAGHHRGSFHVPARSVDALQRLLSGNSTRRYAEPS